MRVPWRVCRLALLALPLQAWTTKYFGCELGCISTFEHDSGYAVVNGKHDDAALQKVFKKFMRNFVICP
eukprot:SAG11_NODE_25900_length_352_cov_1.019763_1_plen_68_part_01